MSSEREMIENKFYMLNIDDQTPDTRFLVSHLAQHVRNTYTCTLKVELLLTNDSNLVQLLAANRHFRLISVPPAPCAIVYKLVYRKFSNLNRLT